MDEEFVLTANIHGSLSLLANQKENFVALIFFNH